MSKKEEKIPLIVGNGLQHLMLTCYENGDILSLLKFFPDMPCKTLLSLCEKRAHIEGDSVNGFDFIIDEEDEEDEED